MSHVRVCLDVRASLMFMYHVLVPTTQPTTTKHCMSKSNFLEASYYLSEFKMVSAGVMALCWLLLCRLSGSHRVLCCFLSSIVSAPTHSTSFKSWEYKFRLETRIVSWCVANARLRSVTDWLQFQCERPIIPEKRENRPKWMQEIPNSFIIYDELMIRWIEKKTFVILVSLTKR